MEAISLPSPEVPISPNTSRTPFTLLLQVPSKLLFAPSEALSLPETSQLKGSGTTSLGLEVHGLPQVSQGAKKPHKEKHQHDLKVDIGLKRIISSCQSVTLPW